MIEKQRRWHNQIMAPKAPRRLPGLLLSLSCTMLFACGPETEGNADEASETGTSQGEEGSAEEGGTEEGGTADEGSTTEGAMCEPNYASQTTFDIDVSGWPVPFESGEAQVIECTTTQAEVQGLGLVMDFDCTDLTAVGNIQITVGSLGVIDPPMTVGTQVQLNVLGYYFGGDVVDPEAPQVRELGFTAEEFAVSDGEGLLVGAFAGPNIRDVYAPIQASPQSPCGEPDIDNNEDFEGQLRVQDLAGENVMDYAPGVRGDWTAPDGTAYRVDTGRVTAYSCCHAPWQVEAVFARLVP